MKTKVVNLRYEEYDKFIGRPSALGNPYIISVHGTRQECIDKYDVYARQSQQILALLPYLVGKRLGCFCKPLPCHGDVLVQLIRELGLEKGAG